jgi:integral membrane protein
VLTRLLRPSPSALAGALLRYRVMAYIVGVGLAILVFVGIPLQYGAGDKTVVAVVGPLHGFLYIIYLVAALDLARRARFTIVEMLAMIGAGLRPGLAFVIERRVTHKVDAKIAALAAPEAPTAS